MYSTGYPRSNTIALQAKSLHKSKSKSCGYYMRIVFFFSSLIQTLIIVSLVLFLIYGQPEKSAEEKHVGELSDNFKRVSLDNLQLRKDKADLGATLGKMTGEKSTLEKDITKLKTDLEVSKNNTEAEKLKLGRCTLEKRKVEIMRATQIPCPPPVKDHTGASAEKHQGRMIELVAKNFTLKVDELQRELESAVRARDEHQAIAAAAKKQSEQLSEQLKLYTQKCKEDFSAPLQGIQEVTAAFLAKIDTVFPHQLTFHLTCDKQQDQLDGIRRNCTNLSRQVEHKYQVYLDGVGNTVARLQGLRSDLEVQNQQLKGDLHTCTGEVSELRRQSQEQKAASEQKQKKDSRDMANEKERLHLLLEMQTLKLNMCHEKVALLQPLKPAPPKPPLTPGGLPIPGQIG